MATAITKSVPPTDWPIHNYIEHLRTHRADLSARYQIAEIGVFGSYVRNQQHPASDLDVLVSFSETPGLFKLVALEDDLSALLNIKVDLAVKSALRPRIATRILSEVILI
ncbi:nucleotidyltransferase family protein [Candidatus Oscillochloris fontis]|uniref:nucleotidyltransferase family protein n=1 Tax=Candidatus Oscillochloris fontis TaxID=2496868 RepID=UPI00101D9A3E|nr:nucleotidyltransferase family protein [Candidatus Oscillochloris fontis]